VHFKGLSSTQVKLRYTDSQIEHEKGEDKVVQLNVSRDAAECKDSL
jgi:hypothetical protein